MIRTLLATAGVAIAAATLAAPAAQACVSCEYKPEVLGNSSTESRPQKRARVDAVVKSRKAKPEKDYAEDRKAARRKAAAAEARHEQARDAAAEARREKSREAAAEKASAEKEAVAARTPSEPSSTSSHSVYNTLIKTTEPINKPSAASAETVEPAAVTAPETNVSTEPQVSPKPKVAKTVDTADVSPSTTQVVSEPTTTAVAPAASEPITVTQDKGNKETGCKKFFPMADLTLTVECK